MIPIDTGMPYESLAQSINLRANETGVVAVAWTADQPRLRVETLALGAEYTISASQEGTSTAVIFAEATGGAGVSSLEVSGFDASRGRVYLRWGACAPSPCASLDLMVSGTAGAIELSFASGTSIEAIGAVINVFSAWTGVSGAPTPSNEHLELRSVQRGVDAFVSITAHGPDDPAPLYEEVHSRTGFAALSASGADRAEADLDCSGGVDEVDLAELLTLWGGPSPGHGDLDGSGSVGLSDLLMLLTAME